MDVLPPEASVQRSWRVGFISAETETVMTRFNPSDGTECAQIHSDDLHVSGNVEVAPTALSRQPVLVAV